MAYAYVGSAITSTETTAITYTSTAGNLLVIVMNAGAGSGNCFATSITGGGTWLSAVGTIGTTGNTVVDGNGFYDGVYYCLNNPGVTSITVNTNVAPGQRGIAIIEYSGIASYIGSSNASESSPGVGANAYNSGNVNITAVPALLLGWCVGSNNTNNFTAGTSPTAFTSRLAASFANADPTILEDARITSSGNVAATFSNLTAQLGESFALAFAETHTGLNLTSFVQGTAPTSVGISVPASSGCIIVLANWFPVQTTFSVSDNVNAGNYQQIATWTFNTATWGLFAMQANATGTPTISLSTGGAQVLIFSYSGLKGTLFFPTADTANNSGVGTAITSGSFNCSVNNEYAVAYAAGTSGSPPNFGGVAPFTAFEKTTNSNNRASLWDMSIANPSGLSIGTSVGLSGTNGASLTWLSYVWGFYDQAIIYTPYTQTQFFVTDTIIQQ
jgi:hypothetical protein